jgi:hypothetical protein
MDQLFAAVAKNLCCERSVRHFAHLAHQADRLRERRVSVTESVCERSRGHLSEQGRTDKSASPALGNGEGSQPPTDLLEAERHHAVADTILDCLTCQPEC